MRPPSIVAPHFLLQSQERLFVKSHLNQISASNGGALDGFRDTVSRIEQQERILSIPVEGSGGLWLPRTLVFSAFEVAPYAETDDGFLANPRDPPVGGVRL